MSYTDAELLLATQVAYLDIGDETSVQQYINNMERAYGEAYNAGTLDGRTKAQMDTIKNLKNLAAENHIDYSQWTIKAVRDSEDTTGMYASLIDTGDGNAIIGFRGSESYDIGQTVRDWGMSDIGLLNNALTPQQEDAQDFMKKIYREYGDQYNSFSVTGHSLGGNLAEHATLTSSDGMYKKIDRCVSFDGPGFSDEYLLVHGVDILRHAGKVDHYQWSIVGTLLNPVPGTHYRTIDAKTPSQEKAGNIPPLVYRHATENVIFNDDGSVRNGTMDPLAVGGFVISKYIEDVPGAQVDETIVGVLILALIAYGDQIVKNISDNISKITSYMQSWFDNLLYGGVSGDFTVNTDALARAADQYESIAGRIRLISEEADDIRSSLPYMSGAGSLYKTKLRFISLNINRDAGYADKFRILLDKDLGRYLSGDNNAAEQFI